jgi:hypothetical protein
MATTGTGLARGAIGLREVLFQSVTSMAPAGAVALSIAAGATYAGGALPLAVLLALIACLLVATSIGQLAKHLPSAGSIYTYPAEAIHPALGFLVGWGYALVEALLGPITMVLFGYLIGSITNSEFGWPFTTTWVIFMIVGAILVAGLNYRGIQVSARAGTILGASEILVFLALAVWLIAKAGSRNTFNVFTLHYATIKGLPGLLRHRRRFHLHHPGVHRLRGLRAAGRGSPPPATHHPGRRGGIVPGHRPVLRAHHLRGRRVLRAYQVRHLRLARRRQPVDPAGPRRLGPRLGGGVLRHLELHVR